MDSNHPYECHKLACSTANTTPGHSVGTRCRTRTGMPKRGIFRRRFWIRTMMGFHPFSEVPCVYRFHQAGVSLRCYHQLPVLSTDDPSSMESIRCQLASLDRFERPTLSLGRRRSIQLSYRESSTCYLNVRSALSPVNQRLFQQLYRLLCGHEPVDPDGVNQ